MESAKSVVLLKSPYLESYGSLNTGNNYISLGSLYLHAYLKKNDVPAYFFDPEAECLDDNQLIKLVEDKNPLIIGINCGTANYPQAKKLAVLMKTHFRDTYIILGGPHATAAPEIVFKYDSDKFDYLCIGEGEVTLFELYQNLAGDGDISKVKGIAFMSAGRMITTENRPLIENLDILPHPSWDQVDLNNYSPQANFNKGIKSAILITSRGCPFKCDYCQSKLILGRKIRFHSAEYVLDEIETLYHKYGIRHFRFVDDVFTVNQARLKLIVKGILKRNLDIKFWCMARANMLNDEMIQLLKNGGLDSISIGVESGDNEILKDIGKEITREDVERAFALLKKHKVESQAFFMLGFYNDTYESIMKTIKFSIKLDPNFVSWAVMIPYPGTPVFDKYYKDKIDFSDSNVWRYFMGLGGELAGFGSKYFSREELCGLMTYGFRKFYLRPVKIFKLICKIKGFDQLKEYIIAGMVLILKRKKLFG